MPLSTNQSEARASGTLARVLVAADGTLANILEAYACEPIQVVKLAQSFDEGTSVGRQDPALAINAGERVLRRSILLQGARSGVNFVSVEGIVRTDRLPPGVVTELVSSTTPLRRILSENRIGSFRELVSAGTEPAGTYARYFEMEPTATLMRRTYRLLIDEEAAMLITERFPLDRVP